MSTALKVGPKQNPQTIKTAMADGALTANSLLIKGSNQQDVAPIAGTDNEAVIGAIDYAAADNEMVSILGNGSIVALLADGTVDDGDEVVSGDTVDGVQTVANFNPANNGVVHIVGKIVPGGGATDGNRCYVEIGLRDYVHGE